MKALAGLVDMNSDVGVSSAFAAAIAIHTVEESFQVPSYQVAFGYQQPNTISEVLLDSLPIFLILPFAAYLTRALPWIRDTLLAVALFHPFLDHLLLSLKWKRRRPGSLTAFTLLLPLAIFNLTQNNTKRISLLGGGLGLLISIFLYVAAKTEIETLVHNRRGFGKGN